MSLDVYLIMPGVKSEKRSSGIFIRENGETKEISKDEWDIRYPNREPVVMDTDSAFTDEVYSANITHNLGKMADEACIYDALWRPEEIGAVKARDIIGKLALSLDVLKSDPNHFKKFNPSNGWGTYEGLVSFIEMYLEACQQYPDAEINVSR